MRETTVATAVDEQSSNDDGTEEADEDVYPLQRKRIGKGRGGDGEEKNSSEEEDEEDEDGGKMEDDGAVEDDEATSPRRSQRSSQYMFSNHLANV